MPDPRLHGNGIACPTCKGRGRVPSGRLTIAPIDGGKRAKPVLDMNYCVSCRGTGRVARPVAEIIDEMRSARHD